MTQAQFSILDALILSRVGIADQKEITIWAALALGIAQALGGLVASAQLQTLAAQVWA
jgi:hypothetical protein